MANETGATSGPAEADEKRLRPAPPTIDLTATDVSKAQAEPLSEPSTADPMGVDPAAEMLDADAIEPESNRPSEPLAADSANLALDRRRMRRSARLAGAAMGMVTGALAAGAVLGGLWWTGWLAASSRDPGDADRVAAIENQLRALSARPSPSAPMPDADLVRRVGALEQAGQRYAALDARLTKAEAAVNAPRPQTTAPAADPAVGPQLATVEAAGQALRHEVIEMRKRLDQVAASAQGARDAAMQSSGATVAATADTAGEMTRIGERLAATERAIATMQPAIAKAAVPEADRAARLATAVLALQAAVDRGQAFSGELASVRVLLGDTPALQPLAAVAADGLVPQPALMRELTTLVVTTRRTAAAKDTAGTSMLDRLQASASNLVRVQPVDQPSPQQPGSSASSDPLLRLEAAAARNDSAASLAAIDLLPTEQQSVFAAWKSKAQARAAALTALRDLAAQSIAALGAPPR